MGLVAANCLVAPAQNVTSLEWSWFSAALTSLSDGISTETLYLSPAFWAKSLKVSHFGFRFSTGELSHLPRLFRGSEQTVDQVVLFEH